MMIKKYNNLFVMFSLMLTFCLLQNGQTISAQTRVVQKSNDFSSAAKQNERLQYSLNWTFGRKRQKGWYLYVPLLQKTLKVDVEAKTPEFAKAVYDWQKLNRLYANGIINTKTLYSFIKHWQSKRLKPIILAKDNQLLTANISNFYDPTRDVELLKVEKETFKAYKKMIEAAVADKSLGLNIDQEGNLKDNEQFLKLISTYRSPAYQASLRRKQPNASRAQIAFKSPHFTGHALDIYVGGKPVSTKDFNRAIQIKTPAYLWLVENAEKFGFYPYFYEPWHWEYVPKNLIGK